MWTRKEAYLKGIGTGLARGVAADYLGATGLAPLPAGWSVLDVPVPDGHAAAAAVLGARTRPPGCWSWRRKPSRPATAAGVATGRP